MADLRRSFRVSSIIFQLLIFLTCQSSSKSPMRSRSSKTRSNADESTDPRRSGTVGSRWNPSSVELTMCRSASPLLSCRGELEKKGGGGLGLQQVIHMITGKSMRPLFRPILRRRWKWTLSLLLWDTEALSVREGKRMLE